MRTPNQGKRLFKNPVLEWLSRSSAPLVISSLFIVALAVFCLGIFQMRISFWKLAFLFLVGLVLFSLAEYLIHRFVFHDGDYKAGKSWKTKIHAIHHDIPTDPERLTLPLPVALFASFLVFFIFKIILGNLAFGVFPGFISGYAFYLLVHFLIHTRKPPQNHLKILWRNHHIHHHLKEDKAYGVTTPFWDWVFGTLP
ncbi:MAG: sterol desaturase family protein [Algoriphagus sp.]|uniref:sterol desaturase family protein n=1 Tax=Algoriphagus sp. TaxID=1872435 RepID=UPI0018198C4D|nr:sterol desaturase family protein [Algoriphagus sp.]NVJ84669.1 sterol desaturase family protein [Algoriphagus sp.]